VTRRLALVVGVGLASRGGGCEQDLTTMARVLRQKAAP